MSAEATAAGKQDKGVVLGPDEGDGYWWLGSLTVNKISGETMSLVDHLVPPGYSPPLHIHRHQDEVFIITKGEFSFWCGDDTWKAGPGSVVFLPRGVPHRFLASDDGEARALIATVPGGFSELVVELGEPTDQLTVPGPDVPVPAPERIGAVSLAHGVERVA